MDSCNVCGGRDMNLVDGYYYCVECGTQDMNVRETVVEQTAIGDGTFAYTTSKRFRTVIKDGIEMSSEWHKWHTFNFILLGLTDELISLGAKPSVKMKVLWIWTRYVKQFQVKDEFIPKIGLEVTDDNDNNILKEDGDNESYREDSCDEHSSHETKNNSTKPKSAKVGRDIKTVTKGTLLTILYVALNLDRSDIQLSHLFRFIREGRLSLYECMKYVPKDLKINAVKNYKSFVLSQREHNPMSIRKLGLTFFKILKLGVPLVPDLRKLVKNFVQELCLPSEVNDLVFALMHLMPVEFLNIDAKVQKSLIRIPDYEGICMAYILVALKICFGLDDEYELRISEEIDKINNEQNYLKSYKLGLFSEPCDRLFSFKEWCQYLQFRKHILCKNYLPIARQFNNQTDDYVFMEHLEKRNKRGIKLSDEVTMDILSQIKSDHESEIILKTEFPVTLTPMSTYTGVIAKHVENPQLQLLLYEDFTQYSLRYAVKDFKLSDHFDDIDNPIVGVCKSNKILNKFVVGTLTVQEGDMTMVYVRNCQNKNWLKTQPPKMQHVTKICINENSSDKENDHDENYNIENSILESDDPYVTANDESIHNSIEISEAIEDVYGKECIFDDNFMDIITVASKKDSVIIKEENVNSDFEINTQINLNLQDSKINSIDNIQHSQEREMSSMQLNTSIFEDHCEKRQMSVMQFDPNTFDRDKIIKELIEVACKKYKISIPKENSVKKQKKRNLPQDKVLSIEVKKKRTTNQSKPGEAKRAIDNFVSAYYNKLHNDIFNEFSQQFKSFIENVYELNNIDTANVLHSQNEMNESDIMNYQDKVHNADISYFSEKDVSHTDINSNGNLVENNQGMINSDEQNRDSVIMEETLEDDINHEQFLKSDPKFDEKNHDIKQLYLKLGEELDMTNFSISDYSNDPKVDKIIQSQIQHCSGIHLNSLDKNIVNIDNDRTDSSDSDDDIPDSTLKENSSFKREQEEKQKVNLECLLRDPSSVKKFRYWIRHYKSTCFVKSRDIGKKFDMELSENLPKSFVFIIRECASILGYSMFSLYKTMQNIEEILIPNAY